MYIAYFSPTGGTRKAAEIIGKEIDPDDTMIDITPYPQNESRYALTPDDTLLVAVPVYGGRVPPTAIERLKCITGRQTPAIPVVVYGNRDYDDALLELKTELESNGFQVIAGVACIAEHSIMRIYAHGRPDLEDEAALKQFALRIKTKLEKAKAGELFPEISVKGNPIYKVFHGAFLKPRTGEKCNSCGTCALQCPVHAIPEENPRMTLTDKCISCMRCIAVCPQKAREIPPADLEQSTQAFKERCSARKEPELFI